MQRDGSPTPERCLRALDVPVNRAPRSGAAGGREGHLRSLSALLLWPANSLFVEGYLTTRGDAISDTYRMIRDAGFEVEGNPAYDREAFEDPGISEGLNASEGADAFRLPGAAQSPFKPEIASDVRRVGRASEA